jgi:hypothetical protein
MTSLRSSLLSRLIDRLSYANVVSTVALVAALGTGTAYAANTVFTADIVDGEVMHVDLAADAVAGDRVVDGSLGGPDLAAGSVGSTQVADDSIRLLDVTGVDVQTTVSAGRLRPGKCVASTIGVAGARPGQLVVLSPLDKVKKGIVVSVQRVPADDQLEVGVCNVGTKKTKVGAVRVRVATFD